MPTKQELYDEAVAAGLEVTTRMSKADLEAVIADAAVGGDEEAATWLAEQDVDPQPADHTEPPAPDADPVLADLGVPTHRPTAGLDPVVADLHTNHRDDG